MLNRLSVTLLLICVSVSLADDGSLRTACDRLVAAAVHHPYGWAWTSSAAGKETMSLEPDGTPARTLLLLRAGDVLHEPKYTEAALQVCRTMSLVQLSSGYIAPIATLNPQKPAGKAPAAGIPARESTCAAGAVLMMAGQTTDPLATRFAACGRQAESWIAGQQLGAGGFATPTTQEALGHHLSRQIALDNPDIRDCYLVMTLCSEIDHARLARLAADSCVKRLLALRLMNQDGAPSTQSTDDAELSKARPGLYLWSNRYENTGETPADAKSADLAATSFALQVIVVAQRLHPTAELERALTDSVRSLSLLRKPDGTWQRFIEALPTTRPSTAPADDFFGPPSALPASGQFDLPDLIDAVSTANSTQSAQQDLFQLAATVCHLVRSPVQQKIDPKALDLQQLWWELNFRAGVHN